MVKELDMGVNICGVFWKNPITTASGTFGFGEEFSKYFDLNGLGAVCLKTLTLEKRYGNEQPRIAETPQGILNSIGLQNPGVDYFLEHELPRLKEKCSTNIIASIGGSTIEEYVKIAEKIGNGVQMIELNISCPNTSCDYIKFGSSSTLIEELIKSVKKVSKLPLIVKLSPNFENICDASKAIEAGGGDAISLVNSFVGMKIDIKRKKPYFSNVFAGLSGPAIKPLALRMVWQARQSTKLPIIGMGGIGSTEDAIEFLMAGANAIAIGTCGFIDPFIWPKVKCGLQKYLVVNGLNAISSMSINKQPK